MQLQCTCTQCAPPPHTHTYTCTHTHTHTLISLYYPQLQSTQACPHAHTYLILLSPNSSVSKLAVSMDTDTNGAAVNLDTLQERFSREFTNLYLKISNSARLQSNYAVATRYLQLTEAAIKEVHNEFSVFITGLQNLLIFLKLSSRTACKIF